VKELSFIKEGPAWYADLPEYLQAGGSKADCLMVAGAPQLIEHLGEPLQTRLSVQISLDLIEGFDAVLCRVDPETAERGMAQGVNLPRDWGWYLVTCFHLPVSPTWSTDARVPADTFLIGLCGVSSWFFGGGHPGTIYVKTK